MRRAHWERSFTALCAAARDGKVKLFGRLNAGGPSQAIDPTEFDSPLWFDDEQGTIGTNLAAFAVEQFARAREENRLMRDVRVDRESSMGWVADEQAATNAVSKGASVGRPSPMPDIISELDRWIAGGPDRIRAEIKHRAPKGAGVGFGKAGLSRALAAWAAKVRGVAIKADSIETATYGRKKNKSLSQKFATALRLIKK